METGALTGYVDVAQLVLYAFWAFFAGLIWYLVRENHREGYPMDPGPRSNARITGFPVPAPKYFLLEDGREVPSPNPARMDWPQDLKHVQLAGGPGAPFEPTGNPMLDGIGPGAYAQRMDVPEYNMGRGPKIFPLRTDPQYGVVQGYGRDPRGMPIVGADGVVGGTVVDLWLDGPESLFRYLEVAVPGSARNVLVPIGAVKIRADRVTCKAVMGAHFAQVPVTRNPDQVTLLEEERIYGFFGGGTLYADPRRVEPLV